MASKVSPGTCLLCRAPLTKRKALKHGMACLQASGWPTGKKPSLLIMIQGRYNKDYWLVVLARHDAWLRELDRLIRDVWVECCDHLSSFKIGGVAYESDSTFSTGAMSVPLARLVSPGSTFTYDYDFGSTTSLDLKVIGETPIALPGGPLCLIARNDPPAIPCDLCGGKAAVIQDDPDDDIPHYYCRACLVSTEHDPDYVETIANSPRNGVCGYTEDIAAALSWYPPGRSTGEVVSEEPDEVLPDDDAEVNAAIVAVIQDIGPDIDAFVQEEGAAHGDRGACMAGDTILAFCTFMHLLSGTKIDAWDVPSVQRCLIEHLAQNLLTPDDWLKNAVPILCRFLSRMEASGRITNASELIAALKQAEPAFQEAATSPEKGRAIFEYILMKAEEAGISITDIDASFAFAVKELARMAGIDPDDEEVRKRLSGLLDSGITEAFSSKLRATMIFGRCDEFCRRFKDDTILERCRRIFTALADHPAEPLLRGGGALWSAAIIYAACQDEDLIRPGKGAPPLGQEIGFFFGFERSSIRNKVRAMRALLPE